MQNIRFVFERREVGGTFASLFLLVFGNFQPRDLQRAVLTDREMHGLRQCQMADVVRILGRSGGHPNCGNNDGTIHVIFLKSW